MTPPLFKEGDVVRLVSGGPAMTVACVDCEGGTTIYCHVEWFDGASQCASKFTQSVLKRVGWFRRVVWD